MRITSHGKIVDGFASNPTVIRIGTETKPSESVMMSPSSVKTIKVHNKLIQGRSKLL